MLKWGKGRCWGGKAEHLAVVVFLLALSSPRRKQVDREGGRFLWVRVTIPENFFPVEWETKKVWGGNVFLIETNENVFWMQL